MSEIDPALVGLGLEAPLSHSTALGLLESLPAYVWVGTPEGRCLYLNRDFRDYIGLQPGDDLTLKLREAIHPVDHRALLNEWQNRLHSETYEFEYRLRSSKTGEFRWMLVRTAAHIAPDGSKPLWVGTSTDIHEQKVTALRLEHLHRLSIELSRAASVQDIAKISLREAICALGASGGLVVRTCDDGIEVESLGGSPGVKDPSATPGVRFFIADDYPMTTSIRNAKGVYLETREKALAAHPKLQQALDLSGDRAVVALPLIAQDRVIGSLGFGFKEDRIFSPDEKVFLETFAATCAQALERALRFERERTARERAEEEKKRWLGLLEQAPANIAIVRGPEHRYVFANEAFLRSSPHGHDLVGKTLREAHPGLENQSVLEITDQIYRTGEVFSAREHEVQILQPDGTSTPRYYTGTLLPWLIDGKIEGVINVSFDVTEHVAARKGAETNEGRLERALEAGGLGIWEWDGKTNSTWRSGWHDRIFGSAVSDPDWTIDKFMETFYHEDRERATKVINDVVMNGGDFELETRIVRPDGDIRWIMEKGHVLHANGTAVSATGTVLDITRLKETEAELTRAKERAEAADRTKTEFVANMSHEFRTPLAAIMGYAELLDRPTITDERRTSFVEGIQRNGQVLIKLVEDILDLSKVEAGRLNVEMQSFDLRALVRETVSLFSDRAKKAKILLRPKFSKRLPATVVSDPMRLKQILSNVIGNAVKFTENGSVTIEVRPGRVNSKEIQIRVIDTGIGIDPLETGKLFRPFAQADKGHRRKYGGTGLGLFISRRLAQVLGGDVILKETSVGGGSRFDITFTLAAETEVSEYSTSTSGKSADLTGMSLLLVEDTEDVRTLLRHQLERRGAKVDIAVNGIEGVRKATEGGHDAILMDMRMPEMDGLEATERLRKSGFRRPIIGVSAYAQSEDRAKALEMGCDAYLTKPIRFQELAATIRRLARKR